MTYRNYFLLFFGILVGIAAIVATLFFSNEAHPSSRKNFITKLEKLFDDGNLKAAHLLALEYEKGVIVPRDYSKAFHWLQKGAEAGFGNAQIDLGKYYYRGQGTPKDHQKAMYWYEKAGQQKDNVTQYNLALVYFYGKDVQQDYKKAYDLFLSVAQHEGVTSETQWAEGFLGKMYAYGLGVDKNEREAKRWYLKAANKGG